MKLLFRCSYFECSVNPHFLPAEKLFGFDTDKKRLSVMEKLMKIAGADCVTTTNCSFLEVGKLVSLCQVNSL